VLILALGAVVVGLVFLVVSFVTENTAWAWGCIGACGLAAVVLVVDTMRRRRAPQANVAEAPVDAADASTEVAGEAVAPAQPPEEADAAAATTQQFTRPESAPVASFSPEPDVESTQVIVEGPSDDREPDEEDVDAADALAVGGLFDEVVVVDEHPRFHLSSCPWLGDKPTLPLPVEEAVELGFTGCARCRPSTVLAAHSRAR